MVVLPLVLVVLVLFESELGFVIVEIARVVVVEVGDGQSVEEAFADASRYSLGKRASGARTDKLGVL